MDEPIVIKGCLNFKLKHVAKAMYENGLITTTYDNNEVTDGLGAMIQAVEADKLAKIQHVPLTNIPVIQSVIKYNETDVKVLCEILQYMREYQTVVKREKKRTFSTFVNNLLPSQNTRSKRRLI